MSNAPQSSPDDASSEQPKISPEPLPDLPVESDATGGIFPNRNRGCALAFVAVVTLFFGWIALMINLPASRPEPEPLAPEVRRKIEALPLGANVIAFANLRAIRQTGFWNEFLPDSVKSKPLFSDSSAIGRLMRLADFNVARDADTLMLAVQNRLDAPELNIAIVTATFDTAKIFKALPLVAKERFAVAPSKSAFRLDDKQWACFATPTELVLSNDVSLIERYLAPQESFFAADSVMSPLIDEVRYKSHVWLALGSTRWAMEALRGLTASSEGLSESGNVSKVQRLTLCALFSDGLAIESIWHYDSRTSAFFAGGLVRLAAWVSKQFSQRQSQAIKKVLAELVITQNLECLVFEASFSRALLDELRKN
ncbi:MAG: hypothetical protein NZM06_02405 [Chloroherpetonaceae bacterium]|nr:hypothetical protein [Chloroherpetonaceae bacterium]MDW8436521.1 hypothetical protein [Chloroherpetonaceae bacterium]